MVTLIHEYWIFPNSLSNCWYNLLQLIQGQKGSFWSLFSSFSCSSGENHPSNRLVSVPGWLYPSEKPWIRHWICNAERPLTLSFTRGVCWWQIDNIPFYNIDKLVVQLHSSGKSCYCAAQAANNRSIKLLEVEVDFVVAIQNRRALKTTVDSKSLRKN